MPTSTGMTEPLVVSIPHRLGRDEAMRRIKSGFGNARGHFAHLVTISEERWEDSRLTFHAGALGQTASGVIDVRENSVLVSVQLTWLLARFANAASKMIRQQGTLMLEKPKPK
jgi:putative polyhydroxyalkanoic acid system protein